MLRGSIPALITPFRDGAVDEKAFAAFVDWQIREGSHALVPVGTTGESPTVSHEEHRRIVEALAAGDVHAFRQAIREHIRNARDAVVARVEASTRNQGS